MPDGPWTSAVPVLAAAAGVTTQIRLGTLVATPNLRHPVTLGRDAIALDDLSRGRFDLGLGPGSEGPDASALGHEPLSPAARMARFADFVRVLHPMLVSDGARRTSMHTPHYTSVEAPSTPGTVQDPLPLTIAAGGATGLALAVEFGAQWVTIGPTGKGERTPTTIDTAVRRQVDLLDAACESGGRDPSTLGRVLLWTPPEPVITSMAQFEDLSGPYAELGFDEIVLHHPAQTGPYGGTLGLFEEIAARYPAEARSSSSSPSSSSESG